MIPNAPPRVSRELALDEMIEVAGPVLIHSDKIGDDALIESAKTMSQGHLLAISKRRHISESVTDILVERGNQDVAISAAANEGAKFSNFGYSVLFARSEIDGDLAVTIAERPELSREQLLSLFSKASDAVRVRLDAAERGKAALVKTMVKRASDHIQTQARNSSPDFASAQANVNRLHESGELDERQLRLFAESRKFDELTVAISILSNFPLGAIERALVHDGGDQVLVIAKSTGLSWQTAKAILHMQAVIHKRSEQEIDKCRVGYERLSAETVATAIRFYRLRERANKGAIES
jgi:uncharacterized protein (DUF2336 family)